MVPVVRPAAAALKRERWFDELARHGVGPDDPDLDERFRSDAWWRDGEDTRG